MKKLSVILSAALLFSACSKSPTSDEPKGGDPLQTRVTAASRRERSFQAAIEAEDRARFVKPAPSGFVPESRSLKLRLTLALERNSFRVGEPIRYRLELQNVGSVAYSFREYGQGLSRSFLKTGFLSPRSKFKCIGESADGKNVPIYTTLNPTVISMSEEIKIPNSRFMTDRQKSEFIDEMNLKGKLEGDLIAELRPGETLVTPPDRPNSLFRNLSITKHALAPGKYSLRFIFENPAPPSPTESEIRENEDEGLSRKFQLEAYQQRRKEYAGTITSNAQAVEIIK